MQLASDFNPKVSLKFELQPIIQFHSSATIECELLYRGPIPARWLDIDRSVLKHLGSVRLTESILFVNIANESLLALPNELFILASQKNSVVFEVSESYSDPKAFDLITAKINSLSLLGLKFAIDDFGNGQDGFKRLYAIHHCTHIKIDGIFFKTAMKRDDAATMLRILIQQWQSRGIRVIVECVETVAHFIFAKELGFDKAQGWFVDRLVSDVPDGLEVVSI